MSDAPVNEKSDPVLWIHELVDFSISGFLSPPYLPPLSLTFLGK